MKELAKVIGKPQNWQENYHLNFISIVLGSLVLLCSALSKYSISGRFNYVESIQSRY